MQSPALATDDKDRPKASVSDAVGSNSLAEWRVMSAIIQRHDDPRKCYQPELSMGSFIFIGWIGSMRSKSECTDSNVT